MITRTLDVTRSIRFELSFNGKCFYPKSVRVAMAQFAKRGYLRGKKKATGSRTFALLFSQREKEICKWLENEAAGSKNISVLQKGWRRRAKKRKRRPDPPFRIAEAILPGCKKTLSFSPLLISHGWQSYYGARKRISEFRVIESKIPSFYHFSFFLSSSRNRVAKSKYTKHVVFKKRAKKREPVWQGLDLLAAASCSVKIENTGCIFVALYQPGIV